MDRIIFNHVLRGFPADEKFMQIVDQNATSITNVCIALFGKTPTIVCGLNVTKMYKQGVTNVNVDDGFLWTGDDLIPVEGNVFSGIDPDIDLYISTTSTTEQCTFFDGNLYDAYYSNKGTVVNAQLNPPTKYPFRLSSIVRANICQSIVSDIDLADLNIYPRLFTTNGIFRWPGQYMRNILGICLSHRLRTFYQRHKSGTITF